MFDLSVLLASVINLSARVCFGLLRIDGFPARMDQPRVVSAEIRSQRLPLRNLRYKTCTALWLRLILRTLGPPRPTTAPNLLQTSVIISLQPSQTDRPVITNYLNKFAWANYSSNYQFSASAASGPRPDTNTQIE
jgi:hypothetical protein